jgi:hypothetical protein
MSSSAELNSLEAGISINIRTPCDAFNAPSSKTKSERKLQYIFPAPQTTWDGPDDSYYPWSWWVLDRLSRFIPFQFQNRETQHIPVTCNGVESFLTHEALHVYSGDTPSKDACGMGVLAFGRLHHLNLHSFEKELADELVQLHDKGTTSREQILKLRGLLGEYCMSINIFHIM